MRQTLAQISACHEEFDRFFASVFTQLDELAQELADRQQDLAAQRHEAESDWQRRAAELEAARSAWLAEREAAREEWEQERSVLLDELESARCRAAELAGRLEAKERQFAEERAAWNEELNRLRRLAQTPAAGVVPPAQAAAPLPREPVQRPRSPSPPPDAVDPVLGSVLAQFEAIEREVACGGSEDV